jgi:hypothetical protein
MATARKKTKKTAASKPKSNQAVGRTTKPQRRASPKRAKTLDTPGDRQLIASRAYQIWEEQGYPDGRDLEHWITAEQEVNGS